MTFRRFRAPPPPKGGEIDLNQMYFELNHAHPACYECALGTCFEHLWWLHSNRFCVQILQLGVNKWSVKCRRCDWKVDWWPGKNKNGNTREVALHLLEHEPNYFDQKQVDPVFWDEVEEGRQGYPVLQDYWRQPQIGTVPVRNVMTKQEVDLYEMKKLADRQKNLEDFKRKGRKSYAELGTSSSFPRAPPKPTERPRKSVAEIMRLLRDPRKPDPPPAAGDMRELETQEDDLELLNNFVHDPTQDEEQQTQGEVQQTQELQTQDIQTQGEEQQSQVLEVVDVEDVPWEDDVMMW